MAQVQLGETRTVEVARHAGFCFGVRRAIRLVEEALAGGRGPVTSLGPVIHNPQVVRQLEERGLRRAADVAEIQDGTVVIRSHGAPPRVHEDWRRATSGSSTPPAPSSEAARQAAAAPRGLPGRHRRRPRPLRDHQLTGPRLPGLSSPAPPTSTA
jgi:hypothetical protein